MKDGSLTINTDGTVNGVIVESSLPVHFIDELSLSMIYSPELSVKVGFDKEVSVFFLDDFSQLTMKKTKIEVIKNFFVMNFPFYKY